MPTLLLKDRVQVTDKNAISCLLAVGCPPFNGMHLVKMRGDVEFDAFEFKLRSIDGKYDTFELYQIFKKAWWEGDTWIEDHPEHPLSYAMVSLWNRIQVEKAFKNADSIAFITRGKSVAMLQPEMMPHQEREILKRIGV